MSPAASDGEAACVLARPARQASREPKSWAALSRQANCAESEGSAQRPLCIRNTCCTNALFARSAPTTEVVHRSRSRESRRNPCTSQFDRHYLAPPHMCFLFDARGAHFVRVASFEGRRSTNGSFCAIETNNVSLLICESRLVLIYFFLLSRRG